MSRDVNPMPSTCKFSGLIKDEIKKHFGNPKTVIELGCGLGGNLFQFWNDETEMLVGVEPHHGNIHTARLLKPDVLKCLIYEGSHLLLSMFTTNQFEVGFTCSVLDHMEDFHPALIDLCRISKKVMLFEPIKGGPSRQAEESETNCWKTTWYHDYELWLKEEMKAYYTILHRPLYSDNSGPYFHQIIIDSENFK